MTRNETARRNDSGQTIRRKKQSGTYCYPDLWQFYYKEPMQSPFFNYIY